ncbi:hypothetical protein TNCV_3780141 [Trichonephila clavipes]|nr:hypothetical protein TNCV_3780141 [Trichonephila clavipes]
MASGSYMTPIYSRSQSEVQGDLPNLIVNHPFSRSLPFTFSTKRLLTTENCPLHASSETLVQPSLNCGSLFLTIPALITVSP